jgi:exocyst complex component 1
MTKTHDRLATLFGRFIDEQMRGIEETKVKIKKRKGVISFMRTFPEFSAAIESILLPVPGYESPPVRSLVNDAYQKLNKAMFESLKFIAKESPLPGAQGVKATTGAGDPEDKEALNYHILLIENMNHYIEEVHPKSNPVLDEWKARATHEMAEHMDWYLSAVIRRPLGKILDFLESTESLLLNAPAGGSDPSAIALRASHSRSTFKKLLGAHDAREMRRGVETLRKRVEKHFGDADEAELSRALVAKVLRQCEAFYVGVRERLGRVITDVYDESVELDWKREDVITVFRR